MAQQIVEQSILRVVEQVERAVDNELTRLDNLDGDDLDKIREARLRELKLQKQKQQEWIANGHGEYTELDSEKIFFAECKKSERVVVHFYRENWPCKVLDKHFKIMAPMHMETRFLKINAEKSPFLTERLKIVVLPTIVCMVNNKAEDFVVGFADLGNRDDFTTDMLRARLARSGVIRFEGGGNDVLAAKRSGVEVKKKSSIRSHSYGSDSEDD